MLHEEINEFATIFIERNVGHLSRVKYIKTGDKFNINNLEQKQYDAIVNIKMVNNVRNLNLFQEAVNQKLETGGLYVGVAETYSQRRVRLTNKFKPFFHRLYLVLDFVFKRMFPKLPFLKNIYSFITANRNRAYSEAEVLGRLYYAGFEVIKKEEINNLLYFVARKKHTVSALIEKEYGPLFKMKRVGFNNQVITVFKFRTMYPYSEYLQQYVFENNALASGGKFNNDFRISGYGKLFRKFWIDELPMIFNVLRGDLKLIGVRPLSTQYLGLYTSKMQTLRTTVKPGLLPPFYADMPSTLDEIMDSEEKYIRTYKMHALGADWLYFKAIFRSIIINHARTS